MTANSSPGAIIDLTALVRPGDLVVWTPGAGEPLTLIEALLVQRHRIGPFRVFLGGSYSGIVRPEHADVITFVGLGGIGANRELCAAGAMEVIPCAYSEIPRLLSHGALAADVALVQFAAPDADGAYSYGAACGYMDAALARARVVVAEINACAPRTRSRRAPDMDAVTSKVEVSRPLVVQPAGAPDPIEQRIAAKVAEFVADGATLQLGVGKLPGAVLSALTGHRELGLHSGIVGDGLVDLVACGAMTNARKAEFAGVAVTGSLLGSERLYRFADGRKDLSIEPVGYTHSAPVLAGLPRFTAINSALEVDLTGQVSAEVAAGRFVGAVGGQADFVRGALAADQGRSIIALPSRTAGGTARIVARLASQVVTTPRSDADVVVTEHGAAELRGQPIRERVRRMIAIAHPEDREALAREAHGAVTGL